MHDIFPEVILNEKCEEHVSLCLTGYTVLADVYGLRTGETIFVESQRQQYVRQLTAFSSLWEK